MPTHLTAYKSIFNSSSLNYLPVVTFIEGGVSSWPVDASFKHSVASEPSTLFKHLFELAMSKTFLPFYWVKISMRYFAIVILPLPGTPITI